MDELTETQRKFFVDLDNKIIDDDVLREYGLYNWELILKNDDIWHNVVTCIRQPELTEDYFATLGEEQTEVYFTFGTACLRRFIQVNFTGPEVNDEVGEYLSGEFFETDDFIKFLCANNEDVSSNIRMACLLTAAKIVFKNCIYHPLLKNWWMLRSLILHQQFMDEICTPLYEEAAQLELLLTYSELEDYKKAQLEIELAQLHLLFYNISRADLHIGKACSILGLNIDLTGKLGKRTKYQETDKPQLLLKVSLEDKPNIPNRPEVKSLCVPQNVAMNDEVRLETVAYKDNDEPLVLLPNTEQQLLLTIVHHMILSRPQDELYFEELNPFFDFLLKQNSTWCVRMTTLALRCKLEAKQKRTKDRSLVQCEEITNSVKNESPSVMARVGGVYASGLVPVWKIEAQNADLMFKLGLIKAALDVYLRLEMWEEVIGCYSALNLRHLAAKVIKEQLEVKPSVKLMCWLGDATDDVTCYEKAWLMSDGKSFRAQRHWGSHYYNRRMYKESIAHFEKSVDLNPLQQLVWLRLGFAALQVEQWQTAARAYKRYTTLEPDNFEAWNNLAQAHIKLGHKRSAHQALLEALRCNFDHWKVWENLVNVSAAIMHVSDLIRAYHRMLDLREKYLNIDVLCLMVRGVVRNESDPEGRPIGPLLPKARELLGRLVAIYPGDGMLWELYAELSPDVQTQVQRLQRAYRGYVKTLGWNKHKECVMMVLNVCVRLSEAVLSEELNAKDPLVPSVYLNLNSAIAAISKESFDEAEDLLKQLKDLFVKVSEKKNGTQEVN